MRQSNFGPAIGEFAGKANLYQGFDPKPDAFLSNSRRFEHQDIDLFVMSAPEDFGAAKYHLKFDDYIPLESEQVMRSYSTSLTGSKPTSTAPSTSKPIQPAMPLQPTLARPAAGQPSPIHRAPPTPTSPTRGRFVQLKQSEPATPDFAYGIIHLYRDITGTEDAEITSVGKRIGTPEEENVLAVLAVPSYMTANDFMGFVGDKQRRQVSHFRMIRTEAANRYMVLLKFRTNEAARGFHSIFNGKGFNSMEVDSLILLMVAGNMSRRIRQECNLSIIKSSATRHNFSIYR
jgi:hypothetical protein